MQTIFSKIKPLFKLFKRYYGKTLPFGDASFDLNNIAYLSVEQALADYAWFLVDLKQRFNLTDKNPVIAFGGSYGGILAVNVYVQIFIF